MKDVVLNAVRKRDGGRDRAQQTALGPSSVGACPRQAWLRMHGAQVVNPNVQVLPAVMGTAIHDALEKSLRESDEWDDFVLEQAVTYDGVTGHVDFYSPTLKEAWDWKTITKKKAYYFPTAEQVQQVQMYALMLNESGMPVERVGLLGIPRDGTEDDVVEWSAPFDEDVARAGFDALAEIVAAVEPPEPARDPVSFCSRYCPFFGEGGCPGKARTKEVGSLPPVAEPLVDEYLAAKAEADAANARLDAAKSALEGLSGVSRGGVSVTWSTRQNSSVDRDVVEQELGYVPMRKGRETLLLSVRGGK